jgi:hypothetical protein
MGLCFLLVCALTVEDCTSSTAPSTARKPRFIPHPSHSPAAAYPTPPRVAVLRSLRDFFRLLWDALAAPFRLAIRAGSRVDGDPAGSSDSTQPAHHRLPFLPPPWDDAALPTDPAPGDLVLPSWQFETLKDAVEGARPGARVYARRGDHHWDGKITIKGSARQSAAAGGHRALSVVGEGDSRLWGRWSVSRYGRGCAHARTRAITRARHRPARARARARAHQ